MRFTWRWPFIARETAAGREAEAPADDSPPAAPTPAHRPERFEPDAALLADLSERASLGARPPILGPDGGLAGTARFLTIAREMAETLSAAELGREVAEASEPPAGAADPDFIAGLPSLVSFRDPMAIVSGEATGSPFAEWGEQAGLPGLFASPAEPPAPGGPVRPRAGPTGRSGSRFAALSRLLSDAPPSPPPSPRPTPRPEPQARRPERRVPPASPREIARQSDSTPRPTGRIRRGAITEGPLTTPTVPEPVPEGPPEGRALATPAAAVPPAADRPARPRGAVSEPPRAADAVQREPGIPGSAPAVPGPPASATAAAAAAESAERSSEGVPPGPAARRVAEPPAAGVAGDLPLVTQEGRPAGRAPDGESERAPAAEPPSSPSEVPPVPGMVSRQVVEPSPAAIPPAPELTLRSEASDGTSSVSQPAEPAVQRQPGEAAPERPTGERLSAAERIADSRSGPALPRPGSPAGAEASEGPGDSPAAPISRLPSEVSSPPAPDVMAPRPVERDQPGRSVRVPGESPVATPGEQRPAAIARTVDLSGGPAATRDTLESEPPDMPLARTVRPFGGPDGGRADADDGPTGDPGQSMSTILTPAEMGVLPLAADEPSGLQRFPAAGETSLQSPIEMGMPPLAGPPGGPESAPVSPGQASSPTPARELTPPRTSAASGPRRFPAAGEPSPQPPAEAGGSPRLPVRAAGVRRSPAPGEPSPPSRAAAWREVPRGAETTPRTPALGDLPLAGAPLPEKPAGLSSRVLRAPATPDPLALEGLAATPVIDLSEPLLVTTPWMADEQGEHGNDSEFGSAGATPGGPAGTVLREPVRAFAAGSVARSIQPTGEPAAAPVRVLPGAGPPSRFPSRTPWVPGSGFEPTLGPTFRDEPLGGRYAGGVLRTTGPDEAAPGSAPVGRLSDLRGQGDSTPGRLGPGAWRPPVLPALPLATPAGDGVAAGGQWPPAGGPGPSSLVARAAELPLAPGPSAARAGGQPTAVDGASASGAVGRVVTTEEVAPSASAPAAAAPAGGEPDINKLADGVWRIVRRRLQIERERQRGLP